VKKAHTLPHQSHVVICCVVNFYTFRRPDVKMTEKPGGVNIKIAIGGEECSAKMKKIHDARRQGLMPPLARTGSEWG
jgi:hypothetical protein